MRLSQAIGLGLAAYSAYRMLKGSGAIRTMPRAGGGMQTYGPAPARSSARPGIDLMKRHGGRGAL